MADIEKVISIIDDTKGYVDSITSILGEMPESKGSDASAIIDEKVLESPIGSTDDLNLKKLAAAALVIAKEKGFVPAELVRDGTTAASIVDEGITRIKTAYQTAVGKIDVYEAADQIIDRATSRLSVVADRMVAKGVDLALNRVSMYVATAYPPALPVVNVIRTFQPLITKTAQVAVRKGLQKVAETAKAAVRKAGALLAKAANKLFSQQ